MSLLKLKTRRRIFIKKGNIVKQLREHPSVYTASRTRWCDELLKDIFALDN